MIFITELGDCSLKCAVDRFDPVPEQILKPDDEREAEATIPRFVYNFENIDRAAFFLKGTHLDIAGAVDREIAGAPAIEIVSGNSSDNIPLDLHFFVRSGCRRA